MKQQLRLFDERDQPWEIDDHTREVGRRGIALARDKAKHADRRREARTCHPAARSRNHQPVR